MIVIRMEGLYEKQYSGRGGERGRRLIASFIFERLCRAVGTCRTDGHSSSAHNIPQVKLHYPEEKKEK